MTHLEEDDVGVRQRSDRKDLHVTSVRNRPHTMLTFKQSFDYSDDSAISSLVTVDDNTADNTMPLADTVTETQEQSSITAINIKPSTPIASNFLEVNLANDFHVLRSRCGSSSTPFTTKIGSMLNCNADSDNSCLADDHFKQPSPPVFRLGNEQTRSDTTYKSWTHIQLKANELSVMNAAHQQKQSPSKSNSGAKPKRYTLSNFTVSKSDSGFCELSSILDSSHQSSDLSLEQRGNNKTCNESQSFDEILSGVSPSCPDRLVGRKMGLLHVDILSELHCRQMGIIVSQIFNFLATEDLVNVSKVNKDWKCILKSSKKALRRYRTHFLHQQENPCYTTKGKSSSKNMCLSSGVLTVVQSSGCPTLAVLAEKPKQSTLLAYESMTLSPDESIRKCPRCQSASKVSKVQQRGVCQRVSCQYDFCTQCFHNFHGSKPCPWVLGKRSVCDKVATKKSKRNLKRL